MKIRLLRLIVLVWILVSFLVDLIAALPAGVGGWLLMSLIVIEALTCWIAYEMFIGKRWALITLIIYLGLRSFNIYTDNFSFYSRSGLNLGITFGKFIGVNVFTLVCFILLVIELAKRREATNSLVDDQPNGLK